MVNELVSLVCVGICVASVAGIISMIVIKEAAEKIRAAKPFIDPEKYSEIERTIKNYPNFHFYAWW